MKVFKLCIILVAYLLIGVLEVYSYYLFKNDAIGIFTFFTLLGFILTFGIEVLNEQKINEFIFNTKYAVYTGLSNE